MPGWNLSRVGDAALVLAFDQRIDPSLNQLVIRVADAVRWSEHPGVLDVVESYCTVTVHFDPLKTDVERVVIDLKAAASRGAVADDRRVEEVTGRVLTVPVCYGGARGPDLDEVACFGACTSSRVIALHAGRDYRVYMLGFLPGFAYMGSVDRRIAAPRRETPRLCVPAGSVGIAGRQTGIYPLDAPGGWQLIGQTPWRTFALGRADPFLLHAGDAVRFEPVDETTFRRLSAEAAAQPSGLAEWGH